MKKDNYKAYAAIYDSFKGDRQGTVKLIKRLINRYHPSAVDVLELACGTGSIIEGLREHFNIIGLDKSTAMLRVAKQKLPDTLFLKADMATFSIKQKFDVIYCVHNSLNHLYKIEDWDRMFQAVYEHLAPEGIFIFDINTPDRMDFLASFPTGLTPLEDVILATKVRKTSRPYLYLWDLKISNPERPESRSYHQSIKILAPPLAGTIDLVQERFTLLDYITLTQDTVEERNRVYCICRKAE